MAFLEPGTVRRENLVNAIAYGADIAIHRISSTPERLERED